MIRKAHIGDLPQIIDLCRRLRARIETYPGAELDLPSIRQVFGRCVNSQMCCAFVAEHDGKLTGVLLGIAQELWFSTAREATDLITYSERAGDGARLISKFRRWANTIPRVVCVSVSQSSGLDVERTTLIAEHLGFRQIGSLLQIPAQHEAQQEERRERVN